MNGFLQDRPANDDVLMTTSDVLLGTSPKLREQLDRHGISILHQAVYEWHGFRYSNASDAIAAAKRDDR